MPSPVLIRPSDIISLIFIFAQSNLCLLIHTRTCEFLGFSCCRVKKEIERSTAFKRCINLPGQRGIAISSTHGDIEFSKIVSMARPMCVEQAVRGKHAGNIERKTSEIKERIRCSTNKIIKVCEHMPKIIMKTLRINYTR